MKVTIDFEDETLSDALQEHLSTGRSIQDYIETAIKWYKKCRRLEDKDITRSLGYGDKDRMRQYNTLISTKEVED